MSAVSSSPDECLRLGIFLHRGDFHQRRVTGAALIEELRHRRRAGLRIVRAILLDQRDDRRGRIGIETPVELVEDFAGAAHGLGIAGFEDLPQRRLSGFARLPQRFGRGFTFLKGIARQSLDPCRDLFLGRRFGRRIGGEGRDGAGEDREQDGKAK